MEIISGSEEIIKVRARIFPRCGWSPLTRRHALREIAFNAPSVLLREFNVLLL